jgi:hypothetical protein
VKINSKACGRSEIIEEVFEAGDHRRVGLAEVATLPSTSDDTLEDIRNNDEEVGESGPPWRRCGSGSNPQADH